MAQQLKLLIVAAVLTWLVLNPDVVSLRTGERIARPHACAHRGELDGAIELPLHASLKYLCSSVFREETCCADVDAFRTSDQVVVVGHPTQVAAQLGVSLSALPTLSFDDLVRLSPQRIFFERLDVILGILDTFPSTFLTIEPKVLRSDNGSVRRADVDDQLLLSIRQHLLRFPQVTAHVIVNVEQLEVASPIMLPFTKFACPARDDAVTVGCDANIETFRRHEACSIIMPSLLVLRSCARQLEALSRTLVPWLIDDEQQLVQATQSARVHFMITNRPLWLRGSLRLSYR